MSNLSVCPLCERPTHYGKRSAFHLSFGESPIMCDIHGEVGYRDHDYGDNVMYNLKKDNTDGIAEK